MLTQNSELSTQLTCVEWDVADVTEEPSVADRPTLTFADAGVPQLPPAAPRRAALAIAVLLAALMRC